MSFRMYLCPNGQKRIVRVVGKIRKTQDIYCSTHDYRVVDISTGQIGDYRVVDISTGQIGIVSGMFLRHTTAKDW
jgi:hypothetical protein